MWFFTIFILKNIAMITTLVYIYDEINKKKYEKNYAKLSAYIITFIIILII